MLTVPDSLIQLLVTGGAVVALAWFVWLFVTGKVHSDSEVSGLRSDKTELLNQNHNLSEALETSNRLLEEAIRQGGRR